CGSFHEPVRHLGPLAAGKQAVCLVSLFQHLVDKAKLSGLVSGHEEIAIQGLLYCLIALLSMLHIYFVQPTLHLNDVFSMAFYIARLAREPPGWLMHHDARVG